MELTRAEIAPGLPELRVPGPHGSVGERLAEVAGVLGGAVAVEAADGCLTYAALTERVQALAAELAALDDGGPDTPIGVLAEQGADTVVAALAVMGAGRPCVLLDVVQPAARLASVVAQAGVSVVLADDSRRETAAALPGVGTVRPLRPTAGPVAAPHPGGAARPARVVFTSGSTGEPKGVVLRHASMLATAVIGRERFGLGPGDRVALVLPTAFAAGQEVLVMALLNGATLCVRDPRLHGVCDLADWVGASGVTTVHGTPSLVRALVGALAVEQVLDRVRLVTTCGEKVFGADVSSVLQHLPAGAVFANWLGSSETGMLATHAFTTGDPVPDGPVPAGHPVPLRELTVLDEDGRELPPGEVGVLQVTSASLPGGYWRDPAATAACFELLPDGRTRYRSGDRARMDADGVLHLLGRTDDATKIRGYLVEPSDVEAALRALPEVLDVVVRAVTCGWGEAKLVAWVVPDPGRRTPSPAALRAATARRLPGWMVPRDVVLLAELPRNERGKVDLRGLPESPGRTDPSPPATITERRLAPLWADVLRLDEVGRDESFTALGGDSLSVEEMLTRVREQFGHPLNTGDLAEHPTLAEFARLLDEAERTGGVRRASGLVRLRPPGCRPPVFCFAGAGGAAAFFEAFAAGLGPDRGVSAIQAHGFENRGLPDWTVGRAARRAVRMIEEDAPDGPVALAGHSLGGLVALRVAQLLAERGRTVAHLTLLDTFLPPAAKPADAPRGMGPAVAEPDRRELWRTRARLLGAGIRSYDPAVRQEVFHQQGARVARFHRPAPWPGPALVFLSEENTDDPRWWRELLTGDLQVRRIRTDHLGLLRVPHVTDVAEQVRAALDAHPGG